MYSDGSLRYSMLAQQPDCIRARGGNFPSPTRSTSYLMTTNRLNFLLCATAIGSVALTSSGCSDKKTSVASTPAPLSVVTSIPVVPAETPVGAASTIMAGVTPVSWADIKDDAYDRRAHFTAGLKGLESSVNVQITALNAKRASLPAATDTREWDFAMKEMGDARSYLKSIGEELEKATPGTWAQAKERVAQAWVRSQAAYGNVMSSTTL